MTFTDTYERTIDAKSRLQIPSQVQEIMQSAELGDVLYIVPGTRSGTLSLYPQREFESMARFMDHEPIPDDDALTFQQLFYSMSSRLEMDKQGRVVLSRPMLDRAGMSSEVVLTGAGNHLDLWNKKDHEQFVETNWNRWKDIQHRARAAKKKVESGENGSSRG